MLESLKKVKGKIKIQGNSKKQESETVQSKEEG